MRTPSSTSAPDWDRNWGLLRFEALPMVVPELKQLLANGSSNGIGLDF